LHDTLFFTGCVVKVEWPGLYFTIGVPIPEHMISTASPVVILTSAEKLKEQT
jgi:hypothetical protein